MGKYGMKITGSETKPNKNTGLIIGAVIFILIIIGAAYLWQTQPQPQKIPVLGDVHMHSDFKVYINGEAVNFSQQKYMSKEGHEINQFMDIHDGEGGVIHKHISSGTLDLFFQSLNMSLGSSCFKLDNGTSYCNNKNSTMKMFVKAEKGEWLVNNEFGNYSPGDLDRILISYGLENFSELRKQMESVTDRACISSKKCPERGTPADENESCSGTGPCIA
ncbi:hypothetical protein HY988_01490 [Candidatus Micrarchaeota archaeon]|nr:hypothetical protein [Candidatus Micrarchaeota archaeon]